MIQKKNGAEFLKTNRSTVLPDVYLNLLVQPTLHRSKFAKINVHQVILLYVAATNPKRLMYIGQYYLHIDFF